MTFTNLEQYMLELINRARANPTAEANRLGLTLNQGLPPATLDASPKEPLVIDARLNLAADRHSQDMRINDYFDHTGRNGSTPTERAQSANYSNTSGWSVAENISSRKSTNTNFLTEEAIESHHEGLFRSPGHRENILRETMNEIGIGQSTGPSGGWPNASLLTQKFSNDGRSFITGVVINDRNDDDFYNVGEGLAGVTIRVTGNGFNATTQTISTGGYQIAVPDGTYTVTYSGGGLGGVQTRTVTVNGENVKVDIESGAVSSSGGGNTGASSPPPAPTNTIIGDNASGRTTGTNAGDRIEGRNGNDKLYGGDGADRILGGNHNDLIFGQNGRDFASGGNGSDTISGNAHDDTLYGGAGNDKIFGGAGPDKLYGGSGADFINGGAGNDTIKGDGQNDRLYGGADNDLVIGGTGNDLVRGDSGNDQLFGSSGNDRVLGDGGADTLRGDGGNDSLYGGGQNDRLFGGNGNDQLFGNSGADILNGGAGNDVGRGGSGNDDIRGGRGNDRLFGDGQNDKLYGDAGNDILNGGSGNDVLAGGAGNDRLIGGGGTDRYIYDGGRDVISYSGNDIIDLRPLNLRSFSADVEPNMTGSNTVQINFGGGDRLVIQNAGGLDAGDFLI